MRSFRPGVRADVVREAIADLCDRDLEPLELLSETAERMRRVVPYDTGGWLTTDPETLLPTGMLPVDPFGDHDVRDAYARTELMGADVNRFDDLDRAGHVAKTLVGSTGGRPEVSRRHRAVYASAGLRDELRFLARSGGATWAIACLHRAADAPDFNEEEVRYVASIAHLLGRGVRTGLARPAASPDLVAPPGMLVVGPDGSLRSTTGEGRRWLRVLSGTSGGELAPAVAWAALQAQAIAAGSAHHARPARVRVRTSAGWLLIHAEALAGDGDGGTGIVLEAASRADLLPLMLALHGLTPREREVTRMLVAGERTDEIAARLTISTHTLRGHTKAIFAKVGVGSRAELTAQLGTRAAAA